MIRKISKMIDDVAESLEEKGLTAEAMELDKISDEIDSIEAGRYIPTGVQTKLGEALAQLMRDLGKRPAEDLAQLKEMVANVVDTHSSGDYADKVKANLEDIQTKDELLKYVGNMWASASGMASSRFNNPEIISRRREEN